MDENKIPKLKSLLTPHEWTHTEAFPSILRLLLKDDGVLDELDAKVGENDVTKLTFRRVIDNKKLEMGGDDLWMHLNIQLIHLLDFLPVRGILMLIIHLVDFSVVTEIIDGWVS